MAQRKAPHPELVEGRNAGAGTWSISVSGNWRLTFRLEDGEIAGLNLEDYH